MAVAAAAKQMKKNIGFSQTGKSLNTNISYQVGKDSLGIKIFNRSNYKINYPKGVLASLDQEAKQILLENFAYCRLAPLTLTIKNKLTYKNQVPALKKFVDFGVANDLPRFSEEISIRTKELANAYNACKDGKNSFTKTTNQSQKLSAKNPTLKNRVIMSLSFGKDSLLSYGLAKEIGLDCQIAVVDELNPVEHKLKRLIAKKFSSQEKKPIDFLQDNVDEIFYHKKLDKKIAELENTNGMLTFLLELIPLAFYHRAKYVIFGNERNFDDSFTNKYGVKAYPSFDQTSIYSKTLNRYLNKLTEGQIQIISLVEPIYNIAEMQILYHRYPHLLQYLMSCSPKKGLKEKWCYSCPMCAKAYLYSVAVGGDPKLIGFNRNFFEAKYQELYPLFAKTIKRSYEKPPEVKEEQLLAFLLAYRNGSQGPLIELFKKKFLNQAKKQERKLRKKYFAIYPAKNIPNELKSKVIKIYQQELKDLI